MKKIQEKIQKQTQKILSTYTADVSGVCSALFELGGMTVMHDASGCNSTYNTHDEPRWYDSDSLVFLSGLTEMEAILGDDQRLSADIVAAARELQPRFIAIAGSPIPALTGCDLPAIAASIEAETGICTFGFATTGMQSYVTGAGMALAAVARRLTKPVPRGKDADGQSPGGDALGLPPARGHSRYDRVAAGGGLPGAEHLGHGINIGGAVRRWSGVGEPGHFQHRPACRAGAAGEIRHALCRRYPGRAGVWACPAGAPGLQCPHGTQQRGLCRLRARWRWHYSRRSCHGPFPGGGHRPGTGRGAQVLCPLEVPPGLLSGGDAAMRAECDLEQRLRTAAWVAADPLYRPIVPAQTPFYSLPHPAFSGRLWRGQMVNLVKHL